MSDIWNGDWTDLPQRCGGNPEVWDQTIGCPECEMNLWHLPEYGQWPAWAGEGPPSDWWQREDDNINHYTPYFDLFERIHPWMFHEGHDPGDEDPHP